MMIISKTTKWYFEILIVLLKYKLKRYLFKDKFTQKLKSLNLNEKSGEVFIVHKTFLEV